ncbi:phospholipase D-like domain-containing protein [Winogradskyella marincola]|uniref:phospholipase D n=1 Tax=Winogradskyella marincola TaxID=3037795 RepID=A0ABT6G3Y6_9FLAO|nr:phospholipase D-like domain-containing protein [Winogradskyella sp. YYF002]MDG4716534.1 phospholipase D-like domain-containing protein [Winogradskyella sp. YYF002]
MNQSLLKGTEIYENLINSLNSATSSIYVVSAWFTDQSLLDILVVKSQANVDVSVVIGDNKDNRKLNFKALESSGGKIFRIKGKGYGIMHQKYCIIDKTTAFHGSYNWTINARKNNSESVIKTDLKSTIEDLLEDFNELTIKNSTISSNENTKNNGWLSFFTKKTKKPKSSLEDEGLNTKTFEPRISSDDIFKSIISAEIKKTNREEIKNKAYEQAKEVSGDAQVISKSMDSLYHLFVSDKKENDLNKEKLLQKIDDKVAEFSQNYNSEKDHKTNTLQIENQAQEKKLEFEKTDINGKIKLKETEKHNTLNTKIKNLEQEKDNYKEKINDLNIEFVKPKFKYHEFIPLIIFFVGLSICMVLFYSSSAYIMLYSYDDSLEAAKLGVIENPQVYEASALSKAYIKGGTALFYIGFFVFIPFTIAYCAHNLNETSRKKNLLKTTFFSAVIGLDIFIAIKVATTIGEINHLSKGIIPDYSINAMLTDINFWLVFFLGAIPFFFLAILMDKLIAFFKARSTQAGREKMILEIKYLKEKIKKLNENISACKEDANILDLEIEKLENQLLQLEQSLIFLPKELDSKLVQITQDTNNKIADIRKKADVYKNDIENDNIQISLSSLKDRVSAFIEGWNEWLHDEYAVDKAIIKSQEAMLACDKWLIENVKKIES